MSQTTVESARKLAKGGMDLHDLASVSSFGYLAALLQTSSRFEGGEI